MRLRHIKRRASKLLVGLSDPLLRRALVRGVAPAIEHDTVLRRLLPRSVVDVGANSGQFSLAVRRRSPSAAILAFEPLEEPRRSLVALFGDDAAFSVRPVALSDTAGEETFHVSTRADSSSLLAIGRGQTEAFPGSHQAGTRVVPVSTLQLELADTPLPSPALLKLDVQGAEYRVLLGAAASLDRFDFVYAELSLRELYDDQELASDVIALLRDRGFTLTDIGHLEADARGRTVQGDFLFERAAPRG